jgi:hypothetical protein
MHKITAPVKGYRGQVAGVDFVDGKSETDDPNAVAYFRRHGYRVEAPEQAGGADVDGTPAQSASKAEWVAYAAAHPDEARRMSAEDADKLTKAELAERFGD